MGMILCTHAIVGAAFASFLPSRPAAAFVIGFASHFALDAIPHQDYPINSSSVNPRIGAPMAFDRALLQDAVTIGSDGLFGLVAALFLFGSSAGLWSILLGAIGAMLPDPLQFMHARLPHEPLRTLHSDFTFGLTQTNKSRASYLDSGRRQRLSSLWSDLRPPSTMAPSIRYSPWFAAVDDGSSQGLPTTTPVTLPCTARQPP
jgi:hypothetical protein